MAITGHQIYLLGCALVSIIALIVLIAKVRLNTFVALVIASLLLGVIAQVPAVRIGTAFQEGVANILGSVAAVIGLGTIIGKLLAVSGGAEVVADRLIEWGGREKVHWTMMILAFIVGISVFFNIGLVILFPVFLAVSRKTGLHLLIVGIPILAGLSAMHGLVPPHPGPMAATGLLHADVGKTVFFGVLVAIPCATLSGPMIGRRLSRGIILTQGQLAASMESPNEAKTRPSFQLTIWTLFLPVILMLLATGVELILPRDKPVQEVLHLTNTQLAAGLAFVRDLLAFTGTPVVALLAGTLLAMVSFGFARGFSKERLLRMSEECLYPVAIILLIVAGGGGFSRMLIVSGVGEALSNVGSQAHLSPLILGWGIAALIRIATGSATVAVTTAAGILAPMMGKIDASPELMVVAMGAGSLVLSHVNDGGFWFVKEYFNMTLEQTLKTWTVVETSTAISGLILTLVIDAIRRLI